ncbi:MAG: hypothetical protein KAS32_10420 [Candidatus Peribacteraceae bacterium]|nr:hypothetical protein [Candidatus Peribacteraceae bacterium]
METLKVEYLVINENRGAFCNSVDTFNKLLQVNSDIEIKKNTLTFQNNYKIDYKVKTGQLKDKNQRFFHVALVLYDDDPDILKLTELTRTIKKVIHESGGQPETLWDDISFYYAKESYPLIYEIENLMRKLITNFMLTNIGKRWVDESVPIEVKSALEMTKRKDYINVLHKIDFIHLADFLFKPYQINSSAVLFKKLEAAKSLEGIDLTELKSFIPRSNWERYFSKIVECEDSYLKKRWASLYDSRCKVAHNAFIDKGDYKSIIKITRELKEILNRAINSLDKIYIPEEDKEDIADNVASNINELYGKFIKQWNVLTTHLIETASYYKI